MFPKRTRTLLVLISVLILLAFLIFKFGFQSQQPQAFQLQETADFEDVGEDQVVPTIAFEEMAASRGIDFTHHNGQTGQKWLPETMGSGVALVDLDGDTDLDLVFANGSGTLCDVQNPTQSATPAVYLNDGQGHFSQATAQWGLDQVSLYGTGLAVGDINNDGNVDLFLAALGRNRLFLNRGGHFEDVTRAYGLDEAAGHDWSTSCGFFDYDNDGWLDLVVANYVQWDCDKDRAINFTLNGTDRAYGPPTDYMGAFPKLYQNTGNGRFVDVTQVAGLEVTAGTSDEPAAKGLGLAIFDADGDHDLDIILANDTVANHFFHNRGDGTFEEIGSRSGVAYGRNGKATGAMGIAVGDFGNDGRPGVAVGNFANEMTSLYVSQGDPLFFSDMTIAMGIGSPSRLPLTFGVCFFDADLDGQLDLIQVNGHLESEIDTIQYEQFYRQPPQLFWNAGAQAKRRFQLLKDVGDLGDPMVARGLAYGDLDQDGDLDLVVTTVAEPPHVLFNQQRSGNHWLRVRLQGTSSNRQGIGAHVSLQIGGQKLRRQVMPTTSYLSQVPATVTFGLGTQTRVGDLMIDWPNGVQQRVAVPLIDREMLVVEAEPVR